MDIQNDNQNGVNDPQQTADSQDGTLNLQPAVVGSAEGTIFLKSPELQNIKIEKYVEPIPSTEAASQPQEKAPIAEALKEPETQPNEIESILPDPQPVVATIASSTDEPKNIVDLRTDHEQLHGVPKIADKYTAKADEDENLFIQEVEKQHGHK